MAQSLQAAPRLVQVAPVAGVALGRQAPVAAPAGRVVDDASPDGDEHHRHGEQEVAAGGAAAGKDGQQANADDHAQGGHQQPADGYGRHRDGGRRRLHSDGTVGRQHVAPRRARKQTYG